MELDSTQSSRETASNTGSPVRNIFQPTATKATNSTLKASPIGTILLSVNFLSVTKKTPSLQHVSHHVPSLLLDRGRLNLPKVTRWCERPDVPSGFHLSKLQSSPKIKPFTKGSYFKPEKPTSSSWPENRVVSTSPRLALTLAAMWRSPWPS